MHKTMAATAISFLLAVGGGVAVANSNSGGQGSSSAAAGSSQGAQGNGQAPVGFAEEEITSAPFTVQSVDKKNRNVVVRAPDGTQSTVNIPSGTPGFDSLSKGDKIQFDYFSEAVFGPASSNTTRANNGGSTANTGSNGSASGTNTNKVGRVRNIRKMNNNGSSNSGTTSNSGDQGSASGSGSGHGNR